MSHVALIKCEQCDKSESSDTKDWVLTEHGVNFEFHCSCGFHKKYQDLSLNALEDISIDDKDWYSDWSGLPRDKIDSYIYPPDVMKRVDLERRKLKGLELKEQLKAIRQPFPEQVDEHWWCVYKVEQSKLKVLYSLADGTYRIVYRGDYELYPSVMEFGHAIEGYLQKSNTQY